MRVGYIALARPTFDVEEATRRSAQVLRAVEATGWEVVGNAEPLLDGDAVAEAAAQLGSVDRLVVALASFTDSTLPAAVVETVPDADSLVWGIPEPRTGNRLRLNSLCGINLACFRVPGIRWIYHDPASPDATNHLMRAFEATVTPSALPADSALEARIPEILSTKTVGLVGQHPDGFEPCGYSDRELAAVGDASVDTVSLGTLFAAGRAADDEAVREATAATAHAVAGLDALDPAGVEATERLGLGLRHLAGDRGWDAVATRCWPECFTEFGGAACLAQAELTDERLPATCEADIFGALTALLLQEVYDTAVLVADLVDVDREDGTAAFWHCGIAPRSMAASDGVTGTVHPNRGVPLLHEFRLRPGPVVIARITRAGDDVRLFSIDGEVLDRPRPYAGTCGVIRPSIPVDDLLSLVLDNGLEHHFAIAYTDR
jgi:L-fucose isomerase-like protein